MYIYLFTPEVETPGGAYHGITGSHDCSIRIWSLGDGK